MEPVWDMVAADPAMASSLGDVRPSPMAYPAVRSLPKLPRPLRPEAEYLIVELPVRPVGDQAQSLVIALRSPATKRSSDLNRYSPDIHSDTTGLHANRGIHIQRLIFRPRTLAAPLRQPCGIPATASQAPQDIGSARPAQRCQSNKSKSKATIDAMKSKSKALRAACRRPVAPPRPTA